MTNFWRSVAGGKIHERSYWEKRKPASARKMQVLLWVATGNLPGGSAGVLEEGRSGELWVELKEEEMFRGKVEGTDVGEQKCSSLM